MLIVLSNIIKPLSVPIVYDGKLMNSQSMIDTIEINDEILQESHSELPIIKSTQQIEKEYSKSLEKQQKQIKEEYQSLINQLSIEQQLKTQTIQSQFDSQKQELQAIIQKQQEQIQQLQLTQQAQKELQDQKQLTQSQEIEKLRQELEEQKQFTLTLESQRKDLEEQIQYFKEQQSNKDDAMLEAQTDKLSNYKSQNSIEKLDQQFQQQTDQTEPTSQQRNIPNIDQLYADSNIQENITQYEGDNQQQEDLNIGTYKNQASQLEQSLDRDEQQTQDKDNAFIYQTMTSTINKTIPSQSLMSYNQQASQLAIHQEIFQDKTQTSLSEIQQQEKQQNSLQQDKYTPEQEEIQKQNQEDDENEKKKQELQQELLQQQEEQQKLQNQLLEQQKLIEQQKQQEQQQKKQVLIQQEPQQLQESPIQQQPKEQSFQQKLQCKIEKDQLYLRQNNKLLGIIDLKPEYFNFKEEDKLIVLTSINSNKIKIQCKTDEEFDRKKEILTNILYKVQVKEYIEVNDIYNQIIVKRDQQIVRRFNMSEIQYNLDGNLLHFLKDQRIIYTVKVDYQVAQSLINELEKRGITSYQVL